MNNLRNKNYNNEMVEAVNGCEGWDSHRLALAECYRRALNDRNIDIKKAILKDHDDLIELIGMINGLKLVDKFNLSEVNILFAEYQNKRYNNFGDFEK